MTATLTAPEAIPAPPGPRKAFAAPKPDVPCYECGGLEPDPDFETTCGRCGGCGVEFARFDLPEARTNKLRRVRFEPTGRGQGRLFVGLARTKRNEIRWAEYKVTETANDWGGRSFRVEKLGTDRVHHCYLGNSVACECEGTTYLSAAKANQRAHECREPVFPSHGCLHTDAMAALLRGGWLDL